MKSRIQSGLVMWLGCCMMALVAPIFVSSLLLPISTALAQNLSEQKPSAVADAVDNAVGLVSPPPVMPFRPDHGVSDARLLKAPQDLGIFAARLQGDVPLISSEEQKKLNARGNGLFFGPWDQRKPGQTAAAFRNSLLKKERGFAGEAPWTASGWAGLLRNVNAGQYPMPLGPAIITAHADLRSMPTAEPLFMEGTAERTIDFFDFFQLSSLPLGTPVYVSHVSADKKWLYVECPLVPGWVKAEAVALVSKDFMQNYRRKALAVVVRDAIPLVTTEGHKLGRTWVASLFPLANEGRLDTILVPLRGEDGFARAAEAVPPPGSVEAKPLPMTPNNMARLGNEMLGRIYTWGGIGEGRDCSLAMRDLFQPFGIWLPRNSRGQVGSRPVPMGKLSPEQRKAYILKNGKPFMTLLGFPGHVGLYVGEYEGEPVMFHTILGLRTDNPDVWFRHVIAKGILSILEPGADVPELQISETLLERLSGMRTLP